jgi:hypothetical protein
MSPWAPLLPKLRGHFAEFLRESYLAALDFLNLPTCVGFGYRHFIFNVFRAFLGSLTFLLPLLRVADSWLGSSCFLQLSSLRPLALGIPSPS